jgi:hypothetical protein
VVLDNVVQSYLSDTPDVLLPVLGREAKVLVQAESDVVAIQSVGLETKVEEVLLKRNGDGGLARGRETGEPDGSTLLLAEIGTLSAGQARMPCNVTVSFVRTFECVGLLLQRPIAGSWRGSTRLFRAADLEDSRCHNCDLCGRVWDSEVEGWCRDGSMIRSIFLAERINLAVTRIAPSAGP